MRSKMLVAVAAVLVATGTFAADVKSISRLAFGPDNILFVADWKDAQVHALTLPVPMPNKGEGALNIVDLEALLSKSLGAGKLTVEGMAARPGSGEVYLALSVGANKTPAIVAVTSDHKVRKLNIASTKSTAVALKNANNSKAQFWREIPERSFTVTDMKWNSGELFVAGLSNQDFASTLRRIPYPFSDKQTPKRSRSSRPHAADSVKTVGAAAASFLTKVLAGQMNLSRGEWTVAPRSCVA